MILALRAVVAVEVNLRDGTPRTSTAASAGLRASGRNGHGQTGILATDEDRRMMPPVIRAVSEKKAQPLVAGQHWNIDVRRSAGRAR